MTDDELGTIVNSLEHQDFHRILRHGITEEAEAGVRALCLAYLSAGSKQQRIMKSAISRKASPVVLHFASHMATLAMQRGDREAIDLGLAALDLSNIMEVDPRDAFGPVARLAFAAEQCKVDLTERATATIRNLSEQLIQMLRHPRTPRVVMDSGGSMVFLNPWSDTPGSASKE